MNATLANGELKTIFKVEWAIVNSHCTITYL